MKKLKFGIISAPLLLIVLAMTLIVVAVLIVASTKWSDSKIVSHLVVEGNHYVKFEEIRSTINDYALTKQKKDIDLDSVSKLIKKNKYIVDAKSSYGINGELVIKIEERQPVAYVVDCEGRLLLSDHNAFIFENTIIPKDYKLPIIFISDCNYNIMALRKTLKFVESINSTDSMDTDILLEFHLAKDSRLILAKDKLYGIHLMLSSSGNAHEQLSKLKTLYSNSNIVNNLQNVAYLDLRWNNKIVVAHKS